MSHIYLIYVGQHRGTLSALNHPGDFPQLSSNMRSLAGTYCSGRQWKSLLLHPIYKLSGNQCQF